MDFHLPLNAWNSVKKDRCGRSYSTFSEYSTRLAIQSSLSDKIINLQKNWAVRKASYIDHYHLRYLNEIEKVKNFKEASIGTKNQADPHLIRSLPMIILATKNLTKTFQATLYFITNASKGLLSTVWATLTVRFCKIDYWLSKNHTLSFTHTVVISFIFRILRIWFSHHDQYYFRIRLDSKLFSPMPCSYLFSAFYREMKRDMIVLKHFKPISLIFLNFWSLQVNSMWKWEIQNFDTEYSICCK